MADKKPKMVAISFDVKDLVLTEGTTSVFGVAVKLNKDEDKFVGECTEEELKAFKEAGKCD